MKKIVIGLTIFVLLVFIGIASFVILSKKQVKEEETVRPFFTIETDEQGSVKRVRGTIKEIYPNKILINYNNDTTEVVIDPDWTISWKQKFQPPESKPELITSLSELEYLLKIGMLVEAKTNEKTVDGKTILVAHYLVIWQ